MLRVGQRLHNERIKRGLSLDDAAKATKIRPSFLSAIEKGDYHQLPSPAYAQGFVRNYAEYLGLPKREILAIFRREYDEERELRILPKGFTEQKINPFAKIKIQQKVLLIAIVFLFIIGYLFYQYRYAVISPPLRVELPKEGVVTTQEVVVAGKTDPTATVIVNDEAVAVDQNGEFAKKLTIFPGKTTITIRAKNRLNNETVVRRQIDVQP